MRREVSRAVGPGRLELDASTRRLRAGRGTVLAPVADAWAADRTVPVLVQGTPVTGPGASCRSGPAAVHER